jgi:hypothetical protein
VNAKDDALKAQKNAEDARRMASTQEKSAKAALFENYLQRARYLLEDVRNSYIPSRDTALAIKNLDRAESLISVDSLPTDYQLQQNKLLDSIRVERQKTAKR